MPFRGFGSAGMAAGIAALVKEIDPSILIIGVEPTGANKMAISLKTGKRVSLDNVTPAPATLSLPVDAQQLYVMMAVICRRTRGL